MFDCRSFFKKKNNNKINNRAQNMSNIPLTRNLVCIFRMKIKQFKNKYIKRFIGGICFLEISRMVILKYQVL